MTARRTVFLVDDDAAVRHALGLYLENAGLTVQAFESAEGFLDSVGVGERGVLVLDQRMDGMSGLELQKELRERGYPLPIVFITGHGDITTSVKAMKGGALDFLEKPFRNEELLASVRDALKREAAGHKQEVVRAVAQERYATLTPREREVMKYIVLGMSNNRLAERLGVSTRTIEVHRSRVMQKMHAESLPDLVRAAGYINTAAG